MNDERFDQLLEQMRDEGAPPDQISDAKDRVWHRLTASQSPACEELRAELGAYVDGRLSEPRRLLIHDHVSRCLHCRHALAEIKGEPKLVSFPVEATRRWRRPTRWAIAAGIVLAVLYVGRSSIDSALAPGGPRATVVSVSGTLVDLSNGFGVAGMELADGTTVRTAAGSRAMLRLDDGSMVEMNERTELSVRGAWSGNTIRLERGDIVVEAAAQGRGRLRVVTRDSIASVRGTVFAVSRATTGSLVSVVEGSVEVSQPGYQELLIAGQQAATTAALGKVGMTEAISWSSGANEYFALLAELARLEERIVGVPNLRRQAHLVPSLPAHTIGYFAIPNLEGAIGEAIDLLNQSLFDNTLLDASLSSVEGQEMLDMLDRLQAITPMLGEEIVFVLTGQSIEDAIPIMMAQVNAGREEELRQAIEGLGGAASASIPYQVSGGLLLVAANPGDLALTAAQIGDGAASTFATEIEQRYGRGVGWLAALDLRPIGIELVDSSLTHALGVTNMSYLFVEQRTDALGDDTQATIMFDGPRTGIASWIAEPGPIGSAEYVSSEVIVASSGSTRNPREAFDQLLSLLGPSSGFFRDLQKLESETGVSIGDDVVSALGTDFVIAIEKIAVPVPGWIAAFEVLNPGALDNAMRRLVTSINAKITAENAPERMILTEENINGRDWKSLRPSTEAIAVHWTYDRGYLIASTDRALALRAIGVRDSGSSLVRSSIFLRQFPRDGGLHNSGFFWLNTADVADQLAMLTGAADSAALALTREPVLIVLTAEADEIRWSSSTRFTSFLLDMMLAQPIGELGSLTR